MARRGCRTSAAKVGVEHAVLKAPAFPGTVLRPNNFYQNDYWFKDVLLQHGVYPQPLGDVGLHARRRPRHCRGGGDRADDPGTRRTDLRSRRARGPHRPVDGRDVGARARHVRSSTAATISKRGKSSRFSTCPTGRCTDFKHMYAFFQDKGLKATPEAIARLTEAARPRAEIVRGVRGRDRRGVEVGRASLASMALQLAQYRRRVDV